MSPRRRASGGFTLIETVIGMLVLSLILLGTVGMMTSIARGTRSSQGNTLAAEILQQQVELLRSLPFDHADLAAGAHTRSDPTFGRVLTWTVTNDVAGELKRIDLKVRWKEARQSRELGFRLHLANRSVQ